MLSKPFKATVRKIGAFIAHHGVDLLFLQETMAVEALEYLVGQLNAYKLAWLPTFVDIGEGFNRSNPAVRPTEMAAVIYRDTAKMEPPPPWRLLGELALCEHPVDDLHEVFTELRDRFKRQPAYVTLDFGGELLCLVTMHLPSEAGLQSLRLTAEIEALPGLAASLRESTGAAHVVLLGDFNRNPDTMAFGRLASTHWPALLPSPGSAPAAGAGAAAGVVAGAAAGAAPVPPPARRTNTGKAPHVYDNFFLPRAGGLWARASAAVGADEWMRLDSLASDPTRMLSDHYPVLLGLELPAAYHAEM